MTDTNDNTNEQTRGAAAVSRAMDVLREIGREADIDPKSFFLSIGASALGTAIVNYHLPSILVARMMIDVLARAEISSIGEDSDIVDDFRSPSDFGGFDNTH